MLRGLVEAYYRPGWDAPRLTSGGLTPPEAVQQLAAS